MARRPRLTFPGAVYHVMSRGNRKSMIVEDDDDRRTFMEAFSAAADDCQVRVYACCLMGTHYHALLDTPRLNLSAFVRAVNKTYSTAFNRRYQRVGHTFEQRFESVVVQREKYLRRVARYIALNPVKAKLCSDPTAWLWSTHRATAGLEAAPPWLYLDWLRWAFRAEHLADAQARYQDYVRDPSGLSWSFTATAALGTDHFKRSVSKALRAADSAANRLIPLECRRSAQLPLERVFAGEGLDGEDRDALILVAHTVHGYRLADIARFLACSPSTISKAISRGRGPVRGETAGVLARDPANSSFTT